MNVLLIGGEPGIIAHNLLPKLEDVGIRVGWHWNWDTSLSTKNFPESCEGVVIIKNMVPHRLSEKVWKEVQKRDLPCAWIQDKFTVALPVLQKYGFVPKEGEVVVEEIPDEEKLKVCIDYIKQARLDGRMPQYKEMVGVVQRTFCTQEDLDRELYQRAANEASQQQSLVKSDDGNEEEKEKAMKEANVYEATKILLEDSLPELVLSPDQLGEEVVKFLSVGENPFEIDPESLEEWVSNSIERVQQSWSSRDHTTRGKVRQLKKAWLLRHLGQCVAHDSVLPKTATSKEIARAIFGTSVNDHDLADARSIIKKDERFKDLFTQDDETEMRDTRLYDDDAYEYYLSQVPPSGAVSLETFCEALQKGFCVAEQDADGDWYTYEEEVDDYIRLLAEDNEEGEEDGDEGHSEEESEELFDELFGNNEDKEGLVVPDLFENFEDGEDEEEVEVEDPPFDLNELVNQITAAVTRQVVLTVQNENNLLLETISTKMATLQDTLQQKFETTWRAIENLPTLEGTQTLLDTTLDHHLGSLSETFTDCMDQMNNEVTSYAQRLPSVGGGGATPHSAFKQLMDDGYVIQVKKG
jgi:hypothetical protein